MKRRTLLLGGAAVAAAGAGAFILSKPAILGRAIAAESGGSLPIPDLIEPGKGATGALDAIVGKSSFFDGVKTNTMGYGQSYLGPVIRVKRGETAPMVVSNKTNAHITAHWHGLHIEGRNDGGPQTAFGPGEKWAPELDIDQPAATLWYHSHTHGETGPQVYAGLAGMMIIEDPNAAPSGLPDTYGIDDIPLVVQDRAFDEEGQLLYIARGPMLMHGFRGGDILVNGAVRPVASVPKGIVRFRILNGSNSRTYTFSFEDGRKFHQVATDGGLLPECNIIKSMVLAPAERAEILVDFSDGIDARLLSLPDFNDPMGGGMGMGGMMGRMMGGNIRSPEEIDDEGRFEIMSFNVNHSLKGAVQSAPTILAGAPKEPDWGEPVKRRSFTLEMGMGGGMGHGRGMGGGGMMTINGKSMAMDRIDVEAKIGETELWHVRSTEMAHPFHIHGTSFKVLSHNGRALDYKTTGLKDVFLVEDEAEILVNFRRKASRETPFMFHCHILEHEDAGMMGQFTVS